MITSMKGCAMLNNLVPWPLSSRSLSHDFAIKLLKYLYLVVSALQHVQFWMDSFHIGHKWSLAWDGELHIMTYDLWSWPISFRSFSHDFAIKMLKYDGISCCLHYSMYSSGWIFPHLAQMITSVRGRGCVACNCPWPLILTYIFKVIQQWLCNKTAIIWYILSCPLYSTYSIGWNLSIFGTNDH